MSRPLRKEYKGAKYHVTARGNGRNTIFLCNDDYSRFLEQLVTALEKDGVILYAYVIMPNHYHLLIETPRGNLQAFIQRLNTAYSLYWRYKHQKPGHVFQGRYGAKIVVGDSYLLGLTRYIHLNPVKGKKREGMTGTERRRRLGKYPWSSYQTYIGERDGASVINLRWLKLMGGRTQQINRQKYRVYVESLVSQDDEALQEVLQVSRYAVGHKVFIKEMEHEFNTRRRGDIRDADVEWPRDDYISLTKIDEAVSRICDINREHLRTHGNTTGTAKGLALEMACTHGGLSQRAAGQYYGRITCAAVGQQRKRLYAKMASNGVLQHYYKQLMAMLNV